jgi:hypothetical protein
MVGKASKSWLSNAGEDQTIQGMTMIGPEGSPEWYGWGEDGWINH